MANYAIVGFSLIFLKFNNSYDDDQDLSSVIARSSFSCLYLINAFSTLLSLMDEYGSASGNGARIIGQLLLLSTQFK